LIPLSPFGDVRFGSVFDEEFISRFGDRRLCLLTSNEIAEVTGLEDRITSSQMKVEVITVVDGEKQKDLKIVGQVVERLGEMKFPRDGVIIGMGGGATTDLAGFLASIWMRGIDWVAIPTTLAAMVDASIGGKTGVNILSGKNLVGSFHLPAVTIIDTTLLETVSRRDLSAGLAEVIKCGMIADPTILDLAESFSLLDLESGTGAEALRELIERSVRVKRGFVSEDLKEEGVRAFLNYGHTLGHAIEVLEKYQIRHGEAVAIGMSFAAELSKRVHDLDPAIVSRQRRLLERFDLPTKYSNRDFQSLFEIMERDKKVKSGRVRFVTLQALAQPILMESVPVELIESVFNDLYVNE
jgi:3-dehydroquinate synthase